MQLFIFYLDCRQLDKILNQSHVDEAAVIRILCNRSVAQRVQIRDVYKNLFHQVSPVCSKQSKTVIPVWRVDYYTFAFQNLIHVMESSITGNSQKILKILLLSPVERDCYELRRILKNTHLDENILIELFLVNTNQQIRAILSCYNQCKWVRFIDSNNFVCFNSFWEYSGTRSSCISRYTIDTNLSGITSSQPSRRWSHWPRWSIWWCSISGRITGKMACWWINIHSITMQSKAMNSFLGNLYKLQYFSI